MKNHDYRVVKGNVMQKTVSILVMSMLLSTPALGGHQRWTTEIEKKSFAKGVRTTASYSDSARSAAFVICDSAGNGLTINSVAEWQVSASSLAHNTLTAIALDGKVVLDNIPAKAEAFGDDIIGVAIKLNKAQSAVVIDAFIRARHLLAIKVGISSDPMLLKAKGSTKAARTLQKCLDQQK